MTGSGQSWELLRSIFGLPHISNVPHLLNKVETFLQTRNSGNKDTNYMLAILDSRFGVIGNYFCSTIIWKTILLTHIIFYVTFDCIQGWSSSLTSGFSMSCSRNLVWKEKKIPVILFCDNSRSSYLNPKLPIIETLFF